jgi:hypothetical protein
MTIRTKIAFTICSNNYLGQANALKESFLKHNPEFQFYIVLVDKKSTQVDYSIFEPAEVLTVEEIDGLDVKELISRYNIIEFNTAVKPSVFKHFIKHNTGVEVAYYLDPDLFFYDSLDSVNELLKSKVAALTPHILSPIPRDGKLPDENIFLNFGIYNLGFIGVNTKNEDSLKMLAWWEERTLKFGYNWPNHGYFVDQLWMALAPIYYDQVKVLKTYNFNMAPWNLHERSIVSIVGDTVLLNDNTNLVFYHFSKLSENENDISREYNRHTFNDFPKLKELYNGYRNAIEASNYLDYKNIKIAYEVKALGAPEPIKRSVANRILKRISSIISKLANKV